MGKTAACLVAADTRSNILKHREVCFPRLKNILSDVLFFFLGLLSDGSERNFACGCRPGLPGLRRGHCEGFERSRSGGAGLVAYRRFCGFCRARRGRSDEYVCARSDSLRFWHGCFGAAVHFGGNRVGRKPGAPHQWSDGYRDCGVGFRHSFAGGVSG